MAYTKDKEIVSRIIHKHDTAAHWENAKNFTPFKGEIIVYDIDGDHEHERFKIGDGVTLVNDLPFQVDISDFEDYKVKQTVVVDPTANGNALAFIDTISQDEMGKITVTKKNVGKVSTATPNWNAAEGEDGYIENRTHWAEQSYEVIVPETTETTGIIPSNETLFVGGQYIVTVDGVEYSCQRYFNENNEICLGDSRLCNGDMSNPVDLPFYAVSGWDMPLGSFEEIVVVDIIYPDSDTHTIKIKAVSEDLIYHTLDENFIPETIARKEYVDTQIASISSPDLSVYETKEDAQSKLDEAKGHADSVKADLTSHIDNKSNPHGVTKEQIGLDKVDNTADAEKSVNYATSAGSAESATSATKATQDADGNEITKTYLPFTGGELTGILYTSASTPLFIGKNGKVGMRAVTTEKNNVGQINISNTWYGNGNQWGAQISAYNGETDKYNEFRISHDGMQYNDEDGTAHQVLHDGNISEYAVPATRTINNKALSDNISLNASDVGADPSGSASAVQENLDALQIEVNKKALATDLASHIDNKDNPHEVNLTQLGVTATADELNIMDGVTATTAELNYVDGVTSNIQTQLNGKQATITGAATSITSANLTANRALVSDGSGKVAVSAVTSTELGYLDGVTSAVQSQLDAKIPLAGVSDYTITGNLLFADSGTTESVFRGLQGKCGGNDYWRVGGRATASNAGYMEIATADDGNEPIYVRQYSGTYSTLTRTATLLDGSGNTSFPGRVTAAGATLTSSLNLANGIWNKLGDDVLFGDNNTAGGFAIKGTNGNTNLKMVSNSNDTSASIVYDSTNECLNFVFA